MHLIPRPIEKGSCLHSSSTRIVQKRSSCTSWIDIYLRLAQHLVTNNHLYFMKCLFFQMCAQSKTMSIIWNLRRTNFKRSVFLTWYVFKHVLHHVQFQLERDRPHSVNSPCSIWMERAKPFLSDDWEIYMRCQVSLTRTV